MSNQSFEQAIKGLELIVRELESGEVELEKAIEKYNKGMELSKLCHDKLKDAEKAIVKVMTERGEVDFELGKKE